MTAARRCLLLPLLLTLGCAQQPSGPKLDPAGFPRSVQRLHNLAGEVIDAFERGEPKEADRPLHSVGKTITSIKNLAPLVGLSDEQSAQVEQSIERVLEAFGELHEPMHQKEFPEDFDFAPISAELREGLAGLVAALPEEIASKVKGLPEPAAEEAAEGPGADEAAAEDEPVAEGPALGAPAVDAPAE